MRLKRTCSAHNLGEADSIIETSNVHLICADALTVLRNMPSASVHACVTDPPYGLEHLGRNWNENKLASLARGRIIRSLPSGMKFDPNQGSEFQSFMESISEQVIRVLKPGGFYIAFSQARLYHRLAIAAENAGFEIRDMLGWSYEGQAKAFSQDHFIRKMTHLSQAERASLIADLGGRKTPQLKPEIEPMILAQKPKCGTFVANWVAHQVGLVDVSQSLDGKFPGQIMKVPKPTVNERGPGNNHTTVKPITLIEHLVKLFTAEGQVVLDPFMGSGSHGVAALAAGRRYIGVERELNYFKIACDRISVISPLRAANDNEWTAA